jgi:MFS family permease
VGTILPAFILMGIGPGLSMMPVLTIAMKNVPPADAGMASGIVSTSLQFAAAIGVAVLGTVSTDRTRSLLAAGRDATGALLGGYQLAFVVATGSVCLAIVAALALTRQTRPTLSHLAEQELEAQALVQTEVA